MSSTYTASIALPPVVRSVPVARHVIGELLGAWSAERFLDRAVLLVSELVTNVVTHVGGMSNLVMHVQLTASHLRVSVVDSSSAPAVARRRWTGHPGGHGLVLVDAVAHRWGSDSRDGGKQVWFELRDDPAPG